jgi:dephospho-CoA kinase
MKVVGLTGGIGAGKSTVALVFKILGIPVYDSDTRAKKMYSESSDLKQKMQSHFGIDIYEGEQINRAKLAEIVFQDKDELEKLNSFVRPALTQDFIQWKLKQNTPYVIREAAILIESNTYRDCNAVVVVSAPMEVRISRVTKRDQASVEMVQNRISSQMSDEERLKYADFEIINNGNRSLITQVLEIHNQLL